jgi:hypothetical protein
MAALNGGGGDAMAILSMQQQQQQQLMAPASNLAHTQTQQQQQQQPPKSIHLQRSVYPWLCDIVCSADPVRPATASDIFRKFCFVFVFSGDSIRFFHFEL